YKQLLMELFPGEEQLFFKDAFDNREIMAALLDLYDAARPQFVILPFELLFKNIPAKHEIKKNILNIEKNGSLSRSKFLKFLNTNGYERKESVWEKNDYSVRGDIVDIFLEQMEEPIRIETFDDEVEKIYSYDRERQIPNKYFKQVNIFPREFKYKKTKLFLEIINKKDIVILDSIELIKKRIAFLKEQEIDILPKSPIDKSQLLIQRRQLIHIYEFSANTNMDFFINVSPIIDISRDLSLFAQYFEEWVDKDFEILFFIKNKNKIKKYEKILNNIVLKKRKKPKLNFIHKNIFQNFILTNEKLVFLSEHEFKKAGEGIFKPKFPKYFEEELKNIQVADYVVHEEYGVGRYLGIENKNIAGINGDYFTIEYKNNQRLYLPAGQVEHIHKYISGSDIPPVLDSLNKGTWEVKKSKAQKNMEKMLIEITKLYAKRNIIEGISFSEDEDIHKAFAMDFQFDLTPDQKTTIDEIKKDMEKDIPMDRLLVGDVGFGKTEVALQAAFKAVYDGRQVVVLTPTTILCDQHYITFKNRFEKYGINVAMLSRMVKRKEVGNIFKDMANGKIDIIIATHKILSDESHFSNLGLLIIDEEQRFGVKHKEKIRLMKNNIDTLTMTATPIPRTLYFSLSEIRPISIIRTPPQGRIPIKTFVNIFNPNIVKSAILEELKRGGQIFFIHNNISELAKIEKLLKEYIPQLRIKILHGRLSAKELEEGMLQFKRGNYDLLLSTTIIEIGIDLPNVNTMIINRGENFGLAQLYQLRGRIGRSFRQAFAYIFVDSFDSLPSAALKRLAYIRQYQELGSGYALAMKDIEIRGIGNLLGVRQWGKVANIGLGMYMKILSVLVEKMKNTDVIVPETIMDLGFFPFISSESVPGNVERQKLYLDIIKTDDLNELSKIQQNVSTYYSSAFEHILPLIEFQWIKIAANILNIKKISHKNDFLIFYLENPKLLYRVLKKIYRVDVIAGTNFVKLSIATDDILKTLKKILKNLV
ncbi:DEAD/DEAH box helicase, partial [bacterium]|nr:DEAD/DEAH box helicase [bacterium]